MLNLEEESVAWRANPKVKTMSARSLKADPPIGVRRAPQKPTDSEVIEMAWCDVTTFDSIEFQTGLAEKDVIKLMRKSLKPSSFRLWRKRVSGRSAKHEAK